MIKLFTKFKKFSLREINRKVAVNATLIFGTMGAVYLFFMWSLLPIIFPDIQVVVLYISSCVIQLVALPLIMVGSSILSEKAEQRAQDDHIRLIAAFNELKDLQIHADEQRTHMIDAIGQLTELQHHADEERKSLLEINNNELKELLALKELHKDIHKLLKGTTTKKVKK